MNFITKENNRNREDSHEESDFPIGTMIFPTRNNYIIHIPVVEPVFSWYVVVL